MTATNNTPAVVSEEEFEVAVETLENQDGWMIGADAILDPEGNLAVITVEGNDHLQSEQGHGMVEWLALCGVVGMVVLIAFGVFAPAFIEAFQTHIVNALP